jgi:hypothetical protein
MYATRAKEEAKKAELAARSAQRATVESAPAPEAPVGPAKGAAEGPAEGPASKAS